MMGTDGLDPKYVKRRKAEFGPNLLPTRKPPGAVGSSHDSSSPLIYVLPENIHRFNCRSETGSTFKMPLSRNLVMVLGE